MIGGLQGDFGDLDNKYLKMSVENIRKLQENITALYTGRKILRVSVIRGSGHVWPKKLKHPPLPSGVRRRMWNIRSEDPVMSDRRKFWMWDIRRRWNVGQTEFYPDMLSRSLTKVSKPCYVIPPACYSPCSAALLWCVWTPCPDIFAMDSKELSSISDCFGDQKAIKTPKLNTIWLELIARVLNMLIGLKGDNYYSKVFKRVNYKL